MGHYLGELADNGPPASKRRAPRPARTAECLTYAHVDSEGSLRRNARGVPFLYATKKKAQLAKPHNEGETAYLVIVVDTYGWRPK